MALVQTKAMEHSWTVSFVSFLASSSEKMASSDQPDQQNQVVDEISPVSHLYFACSAVDLHSKRTVCHVLIIDLLII